MKILRNPFIKSLKQKRHLQWLIFVILFNFCGVLKVVFVGSKPVVLGPAACCQPTEAVGSRGSPVPSHCLLYSAAQSPLWQELKPLESKANWEVVKGTTQLPSSVGGGWLSTNEFRMYFFWDQQLLVSNYSVKDMHHNGLFFSRTKAQMRSPRTIWTKMGIMFSQCRWVHCGYINAGPIRGSCNLQLDVDCVNTPWQ